MMSSHFLTKNKTGPKSFYRSLPSSNVTLGRPGTRLGLAAMPFDEPKLTGDLHPETWDLICVGTGLGETMLARCARNVLWTRHRPRPESEPDRFDD